MEKTLKHARFLCVLLAVLTMTAAAAKAEHYRVYLLGGQSNGNGRADAAQLTEPLASPQTDVRFYWHREQSATNVGWLLEDQWIDLAPGSGHGTGAPVYPKEFGCEVSFGRTLADAYPTENVAIIKYTYGGTGLDAQYNDWSPGGFHYNTFVATAQAGLAALTSAGHTYTLGGMLWQQGERDAESTSAADAYQANLIDLIARVRADLFAGQPLPFIIGSLSDSQYDGGQITTPGTGQYKVRQAQEAVAQTDPTVGIVITDGFEVIPEQHIHFNHNGQIALGQGHAAQMQLLEDVVDPEMPTVDAGVDMITWSGQAVELDPNVVNNAPGDPQPDLIYTWSFDPVAGVTVEFSLTSVEAPTVTMTNTSPNNPISVTLTLAANYVGSENPDVIDTLTVDVYDTACQATVAAGVSAGHLTDIDENCVTDFMDFAELALKWLHDTSLPAPVAK